MAASTARVLIYSSNSATRAEVRSALGSHTAASIPIEWLECATQPAVLEAVDNGRADLLILDAEASPSGGMGISKQLKDEIYSCPKIVLLTARVHDAWLATWSQADAVVSAPIDPFALAQVVQQQLDTSVAH